MRLKVFKEFSLFCVDQVVTVEIKLTGRKREPKLYAERH